MKTINRIQASQTRSESGEGQSGAETVACSVSRGTATGEMSVGGPAPKLRNTRHARRADSRPSVPIPNQSGAVPVGRLENTEGFWMLSFGGRLAALPQHPGMFYVAYLLANPDAEPIAEIG